MDVSRPAPQRGTSRAQIDLLLAWVSAVCVPVAIVVGRATATAFLSSQGYSTSESEPPGLGLVAFLFLSLIVLVPVAATLWFGVRASRGGHGSGALAAVLAVLIGGGLVLLGLPLYLSRLVGWPAALACGAFVAVTVALVAHHRIGHAPRLRSTADGARK